MSQLRIYNGTSWVPVTDQEHRDATDPHTQYHTDARGDARYYTISAVDSLLAGVASSSHTHAASDIVSGTIATARLGSGIANSSSVLKGDNSWQSPADFAATLNHDLLSMSGSTDPHAQYLNTARGDARYGQLTDLAAAFTAVTDSIATKADATHTHAASDIVSGTVATARLGSGTADSTTFLRGDQTWAVPAGGAAALGLWDFWHEWRCANSTSFAPDSFFGAAVSGGSNSGAPPSAALLGYNSEGFLIQSTTSANSGYRYAPSHSNVYFGAIGKKFVAQLTPVNSFSNITIRLGFHDTTSSSDAVDGAYFEIAAGTVTAKTANNSTRTSHATTYALTLNTPYTFDVEVNAAGTEARFRVYAGTSATAVMDVTNTTNIPTTNTRVCSPSFIATNSTSSTVSICVLHSLGFGTIPGYTRARG